MVITLNDADVAVLKLAITFRILHLKELKMFKKEIGRLNLISCQLDSSNKGDKE